MSGYEFQGFEYWNPEAWKKFVEDHLIPLNISTSKLLKLRELFISIVGTENKVTLSEVQKIRSELLPFLLGGISEDGMYKRNSLAKLVRIALGIYINPKEYIELEKEKLNALDYIAVGVKKTDFLMFLEELNSLTSRIIKLIGIEKPEIKEDEVQEIIREPEKILDTLKTIYIECLNTSANHNYYSFFALSTKNLCFKFMKEAYPKLLDNFDMLKSFLGLKKIFEPDVNEKELREDYSIWGHLKEGLCEYLYNLNKTIWYYFKNENVKEVFYFITNAVLDLEDEFLKIAKQKLDEIGWKFPEYIKASDRLYYDAVSESSRKGTSAYHYVISGPKLVKEIWYYISKKGNFSRSEHECDISLLRLLDDLSPALFLDFFELKITNNELEIIR